MQDKDHYTVMEIDIPVKKVAIYNGLYRELIKWIDPVVSGMKQCMLVSLNVVHHHRTDEPNVSNVARSRHPQKAIQGYSLILGLEEWRLERGDFIKQMDSFNCGPIACMKILEIHLVTTSYEVQLAYTQTPFKALL
jgi:hypothetical protein